MIRFALETGDHIELHRLLKATGLCDSGGTAKLLIVEGLVLVDGTTELRKRCKIRSGQTVEVNGEVIAVT